MPVTNGVVGRRGFIQWKKGNFLGAGWECDYDGYYALQLLSFPVKMISLIHLFRVSKIVQPMSYIPLRMDRGFSRAAFAETAGGLLCVLFFLAAFALGCGSLVKSMQRPLTAAVLFGLGFLLCLGAGIASLVFWRRNVLDDGRDVDIRLLLGPHAWGSSDPVHWTDEFLTDVADPRQRFQSDSYAELAESFRERRDWCRAMWAARLCAATENFRTGDELTESIFDKREVRRLLRSLREEPSRHEELLGPAPPLTTWVAGNPDRRVLTMGIDYQFT